MKKTTGLLITSLFITFAFPLASVNATDFEGQEDKYKTICTSSTLSKNEESVCKEFNTYLKDKNKELNNTLSDAKKAVDTSKIDLDQLDNALNTMNADITNKESEIAYLNTSIITLETDIKEQENKLKDRMYVMQSYINSNSYVDFIFGASDFSDMFSRLAGVEELTSYDKDLIEKLMSSKKEIEKQKETVASAIANLDAQRKTQQSLQAKYLENYTKLNADALAKEKEALANANTTEQIDDNLAAFAKASNDSKVDGVTEAVPPAKPSTPTPTPPPSDNTGGSGGTTPPVQPPVENDSSIGVAIANYALSKQGSPYVYGASGPNSFDCSGLVYWAHKQAGINFSRPTAAGLSGMGKAVSYSNLQAGDIITFKTDPSRVSHVGIYIGGGKMVHAPVPGQTVQVANLNVSYWQNTLYNCRRLY